MTIVYDLVLSANKTIKESLIAEDIHPEEKFDGVKGSTFHEVLNKENIDKDSIVDCIGNNDREAESDATIPDKQCFVKTDTNDSLNEQETQESHPETFQFICSECDHESKTKGRAVNFQMAFGLSLQEEHFCCPVCCDICNDILSFYIVATASVKSCLRE